MELCLEHVSREFKDKKAVDDVSLRIGPGVWGLLGANGAGKTTLMRMIAGILKPGSGQITYDGIRIEALGEAYRDIFGYLPQGIRLLSGVYSKGLSGIYCGPERADCK